MRTVIPRPQNGTGQPTSQNMLLKLAANAGVSDSQRQLEARGYLRIFDVFLRQVTFEYSFSKFLFYTPKYNSTFSAD